MRLPASLISPLLCPWPCARITGPFAVTGTSPNHPHTEPLHLFVPLPGTHFLCSSHYSSRRSRLASHLTWPFQTGVPWTGTLRWPPGLPYLTRQSFPSQQVTWPVIISQAFTNLLMCFFMHPHEGKEHLVSLLFPLLHLTQSFVHGCQPTGIYWVSEWTNLK